MCIVLDLGYTDPAQHVTTVGQGLERVARDVCVRCVKPDFVTQRQYSIPTGCSMTLASEHFTS